MSENWSNDRTTSENAPTPHPSGSSPDQRSLAGRGPHFASAPPQVLARVPNLESAESEVAGEISPGSDEGRMLNSRWSLRLLGGAGVTLLVAALALSFLVGNGKPPESTSHDDPAAWGPDRPAPSAALAPAWDTRSQDASGRQLPSSEPPAPPAQSSAVSAWSEQSPPLDWDASSPAQPWEESAKGPSWDAASGPDTWTDQSSTAGWQGNPNTAPHDEPPSWNPTAEGASGGWAGQDDVAAEAPASDVPVWTAQPSPAPGVYREGAGAWTEQDIQTPRWPTPDYQTAQQPPASSTTLDGRGGSATPAVESRQPLPTAVPNQPMGTAQGRPVAQTVDYEAMRETIRNAVPVHEPYPAQEVSPLPQINTNRSMRIHAYPESSTLDAGSDRPLDAHPVYRSADARANPWSGGVVNERTSVPSPNGQGAFPASGPMSNSAPASSYAPNSDAANSQAPNRYTADAYPANNYRQTTCSRNAAYPAADRQDRYPASGYPATRNPAYPPTSYPATQYPATQLPAAGLPTSDRPSTIDPRYDTSDPSLGTGSPARYDAGGYPSVSERGAARFQGGIEKPTGTQVYDDYRSSTY